MYIKPFIPIFMKSSIYTFGSASAVIKHLHGMAHLCSTFVPSQLPLSDFFLDRSSLLTVLLLMKSGAYKSLYIGFRTHGFESDTNFKSFKERMTLFHNSYLSSYMVTYDGDSFVFGPVSLD